MKGSVLWTVVVIAAAVLGAVGYRTLGSAGPTAGPVRQVAVPAVPRPDALVPGRPAPNGDARPVATRAFRFGPPNSQPDEVAEVRFVDGEGQRMGLADFHGKVVLLNIWATWCGPCREEMPTLDRLQARLGGSDFEVVAPSIDHEGVSAVRDFYAELGVKALKIYVDSSGRASRLLNALGIPTTLILDRDGREVGRYTGPAEWDGEPARAAIRKVLGPAAASAASKNGTGG